MAEGHYDEEGKWQEKGNKDPYEVYRDAVIGIPALSEVLRKKLHDDAARDRLAKKGLPTTPENIELMRREVSGQVAEEYKASEENDLLPKHRLPLPEHLRSGHEGD